LQPRKRKIMIRQGDRNTDGNKEGREDGAKEEKEE
jgi:hypothetical protein